MSDSANNPIKKKSPRVDALENEVVDLRETVQRIRDGQKMAFGALIGVAGLLIAFAWYGGHKTYQADKVALAEKLSEENNTRYQDFQRQLEAGGAEQDKLLDQKVNAKWQQLQSRIASLSGVSGTNLTQLNEDLTRKIILMNEALERRYGDAFGMSYFNRSVATLNRGMYPEATEYFLASALAYWKAGKEADVQTCLARLFQYCFPRLRQRDLITRPDIEEKYSLLLNSLERAKTGGKWQVAINDMRRHMSQVQQRK